MKPTPFVLALLVAGCSTAAPAPVPAPTTDPLITLVGDVNVAGASAGPTATPTAQVSADACTPSVLLKGTVDSTSAASTTGLVVTVTSRDAACDFSGTANVNAGAWQMEVPADLAVRVNAPGAAAIYTNTQDGNTVQLHIATQGASTSGDGSATLDDGAGGPSNTVTGGGSSGGGGNGGTSTSATPTPRPRTSSTPTPDVPDQPHQAGGGTWHTAADVPAELFHGTRYGIGSQPGDRGSDGSLTVDYTAVLVQENGVFKPNLADAPAAPAGYHVESWSMEDVGFYEVGDQVGVTIVYRQD